MRTSETITYRNLSVEIASDAIYMTAYDSEGQIRGTVERPHMGHGGWQAYTTDGQAVAMGFQIGPRTSLKKLWEKING